MNHRWDRWTPEEIGELIKMLRKDMRYSDIGPILGRSKKAIAARAKKLREQGLVA